MTYGHRCGQRIGFKVLQPYILLVLSYVKGFICPCGAGDAIYAVYRTKRRGSVNGAHDSVGGSIPSPLSGLTQLVRVRLLDQADNLTPNGKRVIAEVQILIRKIPVKYFLKPTETENVPQRNTKIHFLCSVRVASDERDTVCLNPVL